MFFESSLQLIAEYEQKRRPSASAEGAESGRESAILRSEFLRRLRQLSLLYDAIAELSDYEDVKLGPASDERKLRWKDRMPKYLHDHYPLSFQLIMLVECFYFIAWRALILLRADPAPFPDLARVTAKGILEVRNKLLQHPEGKDSRVFEDNWSFGHPEWGPQIKPFRTHSCEDFPDSGLFVNATEFRDNFNNALRQLMDTANRKELLAPS